ncbi:hypothetical protein C8R45DRAFT_1189671 [Mycena sanguinolenta]|nr:hypothetical protein C8R45DRAFT_1189671 [Mycena sanguinolenta]
MKAAGSHRFGALDRSRCTSTECRGRKSWPTGTPDRDEGTVDDAIPIYTTSGLLLRWLQNSINTVDFGSENMQATRFHADIHSGYCTGPVHNHCTIFSIEDLEYVCKREQGDLDGRIDLVQTPFSGKLRVLPTGKDCHDLLVKRELRRSPVQTSNLAHDQTSAEIRSRYVQRLDVRLSHRATSSRTGRNGSAVTVSDRSKCKRRLDVLGDALQMHRSRQNTGEDTNIWSGDHFLLPPNLLLCLPRHNSGFVSLSGSQRLLRDLPTTLKDLAKRIFPMRGHNRPAAWWYGGLKLLGRSEKDPGWVDEEIGTKRDFKGSQFIDMANLGKERGRDFAQGISFQVLMVTLNEESDTLPAMKDLSVGPREYHDAKFWILNIGTELFSQTSLTSEEQTLCESRNAEEFLAPETRQISPDLWEMLRGMGNVITLRQADILSARQAGTGGCQFLQNDLIQE